ncbi:hypothetical protein U9M48_045021 [Paspalum notatum var. saurae]|uniref:Uncharacterized protein n=1 Tax=Paspalum notatum var. saurae TaxID=547442 RepID=A0AAQ3V0R6_PASNO
MTTGPTRQLRITLHTARGPRPREGEALLSSSSSSPASALVERAQWAASSDLTSHTHTYTTPDHPSPPLLSSSSHTHRPSHSNPEPRRSTASPIRSLPPPPDRIPQVRVWGLPAS